MFTRTSTALLALSAATPALAAPAADQQAPNPDAAYNITDTTSDTIWVTGVRQLVPIEQVSSSVTVLDKSAIDRSQDIGVTEILLRTPGVSIARNGGYGTSTSLRIRGAETGQTVLVVDGVKLNDPSNTDGSYNFANLLVGDAARIEVLRGPQSILWGSSAMGGVVNVVTAMPKKVLEGSFDLELGSRETINARAALGGKSGPIAWRLGAQTFRTNGISALAPSFGGVEKDGYTNQTLQGRVEIQLAPNLTAEVRGHYSNGKTDIDDTSRDSPAFAKSQEFVGYLGLNLALFDGRMRNRFAYGYTQTDRDNFDPRLARQQTFDAHGRTERFEYQGSFAFSDTITALFGAEHEDSSFRSVSPSGSLSVPIPDPARGSTQITSVYGQLNIQPIEGLTLTGGLRHDDHNRYGGKTLLSAGGVWNLPSGTTIRANYSEGFKAPSLYQMFSEYGNTALAPEQAEGWEVGVEQQAFGKHLTVGAAWFERTSENLIVYVGCSSGSSDPMCFIPGSSSVMRWGYYDNVARAKSHGLETQAALSLGAFHIDGNYTLTVSEDRSQGTVTFGKWLPRRPRHTANASFSYTLPADVTVGAALRWSGQSFDNASNSFRLAPYTLVDLRAEYKLAPELRLFARIENLFDKEYMTANRYGTLGRSIFAGLRGRF